MLNSALGIRKYYDDWILFFNNMTKNMEEKKVILCESIYTCFWYCNASMYSLMFKCRECCKP